jgi:glycosyltransferase involved in cell wall biosynthesis
MSTLPLVSCVIPVFNGERYLPQAVESALAQTNCRVEVIVVDDGSTDGTQRVVPRCNSVKYVYQLNAGPAAARNNGVRHASGEFVALLDADDLWYPDKTATQLARFAARAELSISTAYMQNFWSEEACREADAFAGSSLAQAQPNLASSFMAHRSLFDTIGLLDTKFKHRDIQELMVRATDRGLVAEILPDVLVKRRIHDNNMSRSRSDAADMELVAIATARLARRRQARQ